MDAERVPVIVGVGQVNDRTEDPATALDPVALMAAALREADADAGGGWLGRLDTLAVVQQIGWPDLNPIVDRVAGALGVTPAHRTETAGPMGDSPIRLFNEAANRIRAGEATVVAVVGGEALRTAARRAQAGGDHAMRGRHGSRPPGYRQRYGLAAPVDIYPLYENATRAAWGQTLAEAQAETGVIWAGLSQTAAANPHAWLRAARTAEEIVTPSAANRPLAFPYTKLMVANASVNQGAGFLVTSLAAARARGIPDDRLAFVGHGAAAHEADDVLARDGFAASAGMRVSLEATLDANGLTADEVDAAELYSCFPCIPKMARRILGWPAERPASVVGGLTFGGGPIGNYMSHAVAQAVLGLREVSGPVLLFGNGGFATHNHAIVLTREPLPGTRFPQDFDRQAAADALRGAVPPLGEDYAGRGTIETYTVLYGRDGEPSRGVVVGRSPAGTRFLARVPADDVAAIAFLTDGAAEPVGSRGTAVAAADSLTDWRIG